MRSFEKWNLGKSDGCRTEADCESFCNPFSRENLVGKFAGKLGLKKLGVGLYRTCTKKEFK